MDREILVDVVAQTFELNARILEDTASIMERCVAKGQPITPENIFALRQLAVNYHYTATQLRQDEPHHAINELKKILGWYEQALNKPRFRILYPVSLMVPQTKHAQNASIRPIVTQLKGLINELEGLPGNPTQNFGPILFPLCEVEPA